MRAAGAEPALREQDGVAFLTDSGHYIVDCRFAGGIADPPATEAALRAQPGIVETGLFLGMATDVLVADDGVVRHLRRGES
jgi:ribose 5-phosphate isomerase A